MRKPVVIFIALFCLAGICAHAQSTAIGSLTGTIVDTISHNLTKATITLTDAKDTTKKRQTLSDDKGKFQFSNLPIGLYSIRVSYLGYDVVDKFVGLTQSNPNLDIGDITLQQTVNDIGTVVVTAVIPVTLKGDTTEYSADAFGTKPNATVEDLLKKLPGVQVDQNGKITAQGESVSRVFVDGKRFFGNDPKMATQNLPKDVVDKIQVFDGKSDQAEFTGFDDGTSIKTINIVTKRNMRHGWFGRSTASIGNDAATLKDPLYAVTPRVLYFNGDMKLGMFGNLNNVNVQNFTRSDQNNKNGLTKTAAANIFFGDSLQLFKKVKTDFSGMYSINNVKVDLTQSGYKQTFYGDTTTNNINSSATNRSNTNQNINLNFNTRFDSANELRVRPSFSFGNSNSKSISTTEIDSIFQGNKTVMSYTPDATTLSSSKNRSGNVSATYRHAFDKRGRSLTLDVQYSTAYGNNSGLSKSNVIDSINHTSKITNQNYSTKTNSNSVSPTITYTEPLAKHQLLEFAYNYSYSKNTSDRKTFDYDSIRNAYNIPDIELTNLYDNTYTSNRGTVSYMYSDSVMNLMFGTGVQYGHRESDNEGKYSLHQNYTNFYPTANFQFKFSNTKKIRFSYQGRTSQPGISQLQPITDSTNPLNIVAGNPDLKQSFSNSIQLRYYNVSRTGGRSFFIFLSGSTISNQIVNSTTRLPNGGQYSMPVNTNGYYTVSGNFDYGFPIVHGNYNFDFVTNISKTRTPSMVYGQKNYNNNTAFLETIRWSTNLKKSWDVNVTFIPGYNISSYTISSGNSNANYYQQESTVAGTWYTNSGWEIGTDFDYTFYRGNSQGQNVSIPLWNASLTKHIFRNQAGEISLSVHDILNQNKGVSFTRGDNYSSQTTTNILKRYVLLSFTYNLKQFPGMKNRNRNRGGDRPWMRDGDGPPGGGRGGHDGGGFGGGRGGGRGGF